MRAGSSRRAPGRRDRGVRRRLRRCLLAYLSLFYTKAIALVLSRPSLYDVRCASIAKDAAAKLAHKPEVVRAFLQLNGAVIAEGAPATQVERARLPPIQPELAVGGTPGEVTVKPNARAAGAMRAS